LSDSSFAFSAKYFGLYAGASAGHFPDRLLLIGPPASRAIMAAARPEFSIFQMGGPMIM